MKTHQKRTETLKTKKRLALHTTMRQTRQSSSVASVKAPKLPLGKMKALKTMVLDVKERRGVGYRWFERFHKHCFGWYQHIGAGEFKHVHATMQDYLDVKQVYDLLREDAKIDAELLTLLLDYIEKRNECEAIIGKVIAIARRNTK
jgi:hypothetical protein